MGRIVRRLSRPLPQIATELAAACRQRQAAKQSPDAGAPSAPAGGALIPREGGHTVYDARLGVTWLADANLAAKETFGVPNVNKSGSMNYATAVRWVMANGRTKPSL